jgi:hypothetical protein
LNWRLALVLGAGLIAAPLAVEAADYRFEVASPSLTRGIATTVLVKVSPVEPGRIMPAFSARDATVSTTGSAVFPAFFEPSLDYGLLRFRADFPTSGDWVLAFILQPVGEPAKAASVNLKVVAPSRALLPSQVSGPVRPPR